LKAYTPFKNHELDLIKEYELLVGQN